MVSEKVSIKVRFMWICNTIFHQIFAIATIFMLWTICYNHSLNTEFSWHMVLSTLAYTPLMGEALVLFASDNVWSLNIERTTKYWIHGCILIISAILVTVGISLMISEKSGPHFTSTHGWTGLVSWILILVSQFFGFAAASPKFFNDMIIRPIHVKFSHNLLGILGYIFGIVSLCYGLKTRAFKSYTSEEALVAIFCLLGLTTFWSILGGLKSGYHQIKTIFS